MPRRRYQQPSVERRKGKIHKRTGKPGRDYWRIRYAVYAREGNHEVRRQKVKFLGYCDTTRDPEMRKLWGQCTKREAEHKAAQFMARVNGRNAITTLDEIRFADFLDRFFEQHVEGLSAPSRRNYKWVADKVRPEFGPRQLGDISTESVQIWLNGLALASSTKALLVDSLRVMFHRARDWGYIGGDNPISGVKVGKHRDVYVRRLLTEAEAEALISAMPEKVQVLIALIRQTGCRVSEAMGLEDRHLDLSGEIGWVVFEQRNWNGDIDVVKSRESNREFPIGPLLTERLRAIVDKGLVFDGLSAHDIRGYYLREKAKQLGFHFKGLGFHSFRREFSGRMQAIGASSIETAKAMGHSKPIMTQRYTLPERKRMEDWARKLEASRVLEMRETG